MTDSKIKSFFQFEFKLGWGELLATVAIILTVVQNCRDSKNAIPNVTVTPLRSTSDLRCNREIGKWQVLALLPFRLVNNGGRTTSLIGLRQSRKTPPVLGITQASKPVSVPAVLFSPAKAGQSAEFLTPLDVEKFAQPSFLNFDSETSPLSVDIPGTLPVGEPVLLTLGFMADLSPDEPAMDFFTINMEFELSDGKRIPFQAVADVPAIRGQQSCP